MTGAHTIGRRAAVLAVAMTLLAVAAPARGQDLPSEVASGTDDLVVQGDRGPSTPAAATDRALAPADVLAPLEDVFDLGQVNAVAPGGDYEGPTGEAPAGPGPETWTVTAMTYEVMTGPDEDLAVTIDADLYVPDSASASAPAPAILTTHGFGNNKAANEQKANAAYLASHGYVVLSYTSQGFGGSSSCIGLDGLDYDVRNARALIDELAALDVVAEDAPGDPQLGMLGGSYGGGLLGGVAATDDRVDAIVPGRTWHTLQYSLDPNNWIGDPQDAYDLDHYEQGVFKREWTSLFFALGAAQPAMLNGGCDPVTQQTEFPGEPPCPGYLPVICPINIMIELTGDTDETGRETLAESSIATMLDDVTVPTMFQQGLPDTLFNPLEAAAGFVELQRRDVPTAMVWHSGGHGGYIAGDGEAEAYGGTYDETPERQAVFATGYLPRRTLQWFDKHVRGEDVDTGPAFAWFRADVEVDLEATGGTAAPAFGASNEFPVGDETVLALDPDSGMLVNPGSLIGGTATLLNPPGGLPAAYSETSNFSSPGAPGDQPATEIPGQNATFTTAPFTVATELVGVPRVRLHLAGAAPVDVRLFGKLYDVDPDGNATLIRRQVAPMRFPGDVVAAGPVDAFLPGGVHAFEPGHALQVVLATTDLAYYNELVLNQVTLTSTPEQPSLLSVHLLAATPEEEAPAPVPDGGGTPAPAPAGPATPAPAASSPAPAPAAAGAPAAGPGSLPATGGGLAVAALALLAAATTTTRRRR